ncbi:ATP synthase F0 subunit B [candidate division CSSED10-310 bacterium]|uniref:ATP synthase subunit b n=1 Tax=candidate division CSSED10-310 bacterium TaxID=2855610 RepID=A0ABV6YUJ5_UNCC1
MINLDYTFFLQLINFIVFLFLFKKFVFKPVRSFLQEREQKKQSWLQSASQDLQETDNLKGNYREMLSDARKKASEIRETMIGEARGEASHSLEQVRSEQQAKLAQDKAALEKDKLSAQDSLQQEVKKLADMIVTRVAKS